MFQGNTLSIMVALCGLVLGGCEKPPSGEPKSLSFFSQHVEEAELVAGKCKTIEQGELSRMSPSERLAWEETAQGINCRNAAQARSDSKYSDYQRRMREEAKKYQ
jgi:hypothetical protein